MPQPPAYDAVPGTPIVGGFTTIAELLQSGPGSRANDPYLVGIVPFSGSPIVNLKNGPRIQHCHDMWKGYVPSGDLYPQGVSSFNIYTQTFWQYIDLFVYFGHHTWVNGLDVDCEFMIPPPWWINAGHRNGVPVLGTIQFETVDQYNDLVANFPNIDQIVQQLYAAVKYYGFDGWFLNVERPLRGTTPPSDYRTNLLEFVSALQAQLSSEGFLTIWYNAIDSNGQSTWPAKIDQNDLDFLNASKGVFIDYRWQTPNDINTTIATVTQAAMQNDVYFGIQPFKNDPYPPNVTGGHQGQFNSYIPAQAVISKNLSAAFFAASWTYQESNGTPQDYEARDLQFWAGTGGHSPTACVAAVVAPRPVRTLPFVTSFSTGNGYSFAILGTNVSWASWGNLSIQDILPTWRFGVTAATPANAIAVAFLYQTAFDAGSCLAFALPDANTVAQSEVDLYSTDFDLSGGLLVSYTFEGDAQIFLTLWLSDGTWLALTDSSVFPNPNSPPRPLAGGTGTSVQPTETTPGSKWTTRSYNLPATAATIERISIDLCPTSSSFSVKLGQIVVADNDDVPDGLQQLKSASPAVVQFNNAYWVTVTLAYYPETAGQVAFFDIWYGSAPSLTWLGRSFAMQYFAAVQVPSPNGSIDFVVQTVGVNGQRQDISDAQSITVYYSQDN